MEDRRETFNTWNNIAGLYEERYMNLDLYHSTCDDICAALPQPAARIQELCCGPGNITRYLLSQRPDFVIHGIDVAPQMVERAKKNNPTGRFSVMDVREIQQLTDRYDAIIAGFCIPYLSDRETSDLIGNCNDRPHDNGLVYLSFVEGYPTLSGYKQGGGGRVLFYYHDAEWIHSKLQQYNFTLLKTERLGYVKPQGESETHYVVYAHKNTSIHH